MPLCVKPIVAKRPHVALLVVVAGVGQDDLSFRSVGAGQNDRVGTFLCLAPIAHEGIVAEDNP